MRPVGDGGRQASQAQRKPMVLYFFSDRARRCAEQKEILKVIRRLSDEGQVALGGAGDDAFV